VSDPSKVLVCGSHGDQVATFVCCHLAREAGKGFHIGVNPEYPDDPFPDAWCDACDAKVESVGGHWNDESEAFAQITLICSQCYLLARMRNQPEGKRRRFRLLQLINVAQEPDAYEIPEVEVRESLVPGILVKLVFELAEPADGAPRAERMWVEITHAKNKKYKGVLRNDPYYIASISEGDKVEFGPEHILALQ